MAKTKQAATALIERGIHLDVPGHALIEQTAERIKWHKRTAETLQMELKSLPQRNSSEAVEWQLRLRQADLERKLAAHLEFARFLSFVSRHVVARRTYRVGLGDLQFMEIMPRGSYQ